MNRRAPRRRAAAVWLAIVALVGSACGADDDAADALTDPDRSTPSGEVVVFAAASLTDAFTELGEVFEDAHPEVSVTFNFAASSELAVQIVEGAPADVFASADPSNMTKLTDAGSSAGEPVTFASNRAQIVVTPGNPLGITGVGDLADADLVLVVCAPQVPCGGYAAQIFEHAGIAPAADSYEENVRAVLAKVILGEADVGIVYATDVTAAGDDVDGVDIPADVNVVAEYPIAVTTEASNPVAAQTFVDFVVGGAGQAILASFGFSSP